MQLEKQASEATVRRQAGLLARKHIGVLASQRLKLGNITVVHLQRKWQFVSCYSYATYEQRA